MSEPTFCPLCGQTDMLVLYTLGDPKDWLIECYRCHLGTHAIFRGREATIAAWNTRVDPQRQALVDALKDAEHLCKWLLQADITPEDKERVTRQNGINFALALKEAGAE